jgi:hypothetical protein
MELDIDFNNLFGKLALFSIPFFMIGLSISLFFGIYLGDYTILLNTISELGSLEFTPFPEAINLTFIITSLLLITFFYVLFKKIYAKVKFSKKDKYLTQLGFGMFILLIICFFFIGIFSVDRSIIFHLIFAATLFISLLVGEIIFGYMIIKYHIFKRIIGVAMISFHIIISILFPIFPEATSILEWMVFFILLLWGFPLSFYLRKGY